MAFTVYIRHDGTETTLGTLSGYSRSVQTFEVNKAIKEFSIRIAGTEEEWLTIYEITADVASSQEEGV
jgi:hypothetical protein